MLTRHANVDRVSVSPHPCGLIVQVIGYTIWLENCRLEESRYSRLVSTLFSSSANNLIFVDESVRADKSVPKNIFSWAGFARQELTRYGSSDADSRHQCVGRVRQERDEVDLARPRSRPEEGGGGEA